MEDKGASQLAQVSSVATVMRAVVIAPGEGAIVLALDDLLKERIEHSIVAGVSNGTGRLQAKLKWECRGVFCPGPGVIWCTGSRGRFAEITSTVQSEQIDSISDIAGVVGQLRDTLFSNGCVYVLCIDGRVFTRSQPGVWELLVDEASSAVMHRLAQGTPFQGNLVAASASGGLFVQRGRKWAVVDSPSSGVVNAIWQFDEGRVLACGLNGLVLSGPLDALRVLEHDYSHENFWGVCEFEGERYIASLHHLYRMKPNDSLERIDPLEADSYYSFSVGDGVMWSVGGKDVLQFSQGLWTRII